MEEVEEHLLIPALPDVSADVSSTPVEVASPPDRELGAQAPPQLDVERRKVQNPQP